MHPAARCLVPGGGRGPACLHPPTLQASSFPGATRVRSPDPTCAVPSRADSILAGPVHPGGQRRRRACTAGEGGREDPRTSAHGAAVSREAVQQSRWQSVDHRTGHRRRAQATPGLRAAAVSRVRQSSVSRETERRPRWESDRGTVRALDPSNRCSGPRSRFARSAGQVLVAEAATAHAMRDRPPKMSHDHMDTRRFRRRTTRTGGSSRYKAIRAQAVPVRVETRRFSAPRRAGSWHRPADGHAVAARGDDHGRRLGVPNSSSEVVGRHDDDRPATRRGHFPAWVPGHWEGHLIAGELNRSAICTLVDRAARFRIPLHLRGQHTARSSPTP